MKVHDRKIPNNLENELSLPHSSENAPATKSGLQIPGKAIPFLASWLAEQVPANPRNIPSVELQASKECLLRKAEELASRREEIEGRAESAEMVAILAQEIALREALGDRASLSRLSEKLEFYSKASVVDNLLHEVRGLSVHIEDSGAEIVRKWFRTKSDKGEKLQPSEDFLKLPYEEQLGLLQELFRLGLIGQNRVLLEQAKAAHGESSPQAVFFGAKISLLEGHIESSCRQLVRFKDLSGQWSLDQGLQGAEIAERAVMREEATALLRQLSLHDLERLRFENGALQSQRTGKLSSGAAAKTCELNEAFLKVLTMYVESGKADTLEEAAKKLLEDASALSDCAGTAGGDDAAALLRVERGLPYVDLRQLSQLPGNLKVVIGRQPVSFTDAQGQKYSFRPGRQERLAWIRDGKFVPGELKPGKDFDESTDLSPPRNAEDLRRQIASLGLKGLGDWVQGSKASPGLEGSLSLQAIAAHFESIEDIDPLFHFLWKDSISTGWRRREDAAPRRLADLNKAKELKSSQGSYALAGDILRGLFAKESQEALSRIKPDEIEAIRSQVSSERNEILQKVRESFEARKEEILSLRKKPEADLDQGERERLGLFDREFPEGGSQAELNRLTDLAEAGRVRDEIERKVYTVLQGRFLAGKIQDPIAREAWEIFEDMENPTERMFNVRSEFWDDRIDDVVLMAMTLPLTMGVGHLVRQGIQSSVLLRTLAARGPWSRRLVQGGGRIASYASEGLVQESQLALYQDRDLSLKNVGLLTLTSLAFHGGQGLWDRAAGRMGVGKQAIQARLAQGGSARGLRAANYAGSLSTQTLLGASLQQAMALVEGSEDKGTFWERLSGEAFRMILMQAGLGLARKVLSSNRRPSSARDLDREARDRLVSEATEALRRWKETKASPDYADFLWRVHVELGAQPVPEPVLAVISQVWQKKLSDYARLLNQSPHPFSRELQDVLGGAPANTHSLAQIDEASVAIHRDFAKRHSTGTKGLPAVVEGQGGVAPNCQDRFALWLSALSHGKVRIPEGYLLGMALYDRHISLDILNPSRDLAWDLTAGTWNRPRMDVLYHPATIYQAFLEAQGAPSPVSLRELVLWENPNPGPAASQGANRHLPLVRGAKLFSYPPSSVAWDAGPSAVENRPLRRRRFAKEAGEVPRWLESKFGDNPWFLRGGALLSGLTMTLAYYRKEKQGDGEGFFPRIGVNRLSMRPRIGARPKPEAFSTLEEWIRRNRDSYSDKVIFEYHLGKIRRDIEGHGYSFYIDRQGDSLLNWVVPDSRRKNSFIAQYMEDEERFSMTRWTELGADPRLDWALEVLADPLHNIASLGGRKDLTRLVETIDELSDNIELFCILDMKSHCNVTPPWMKNSKIPELRGRLQGWREWARSHPEEVLNKLDALPMEKQFIVLGSLGPTGLSSLFQTLMRKGFLSNPSKDKLPEADVSAPLSLDEEKLIEITWEGSSEAAPAPWIPREAKDARKSSSEMVLHQETISSVLFFLENPFDGPQSEWTKLLRLDRQYGPSTWNKGLVEKIRKFNSDGEWDQRLIRRLRGWGHRNDAMMVLGYDRVALLYEQFFDLSAEAKAMQARRNMTFLKARFPGHFSPLLEEMAARNPKLFEYPAFYSQAVVQVSSNKKTQPIWFPASERDLK